MSQTSKPVANASLNSNHLPCVVLPALHETVGLEPTAGNACNKYSNIIPTKLNRELTLNDKL